MKLYFVAVVLPEDLNKKIQVFKMFMQEKWGCAVGLKSPAHITLIPPFWMNEILEETFLHGLDALCKKEPSFTITTTNFSAFKPRTIFIEPVLNAGLKKLKQTVDEFGNAHPQYGARPDTRPFHPHITIATRDLHKQAFAEAWAYFETKKFDAACNATGLSVLRHNTRFWDVIHTALFAATAPDNR